MIAATKAKAARRAPAASQILLDNTTNRTAELIVAQDGKAIAMLLFNSRMATLSATAERFRQHPAWRSA
jgi:hypothetical protein